MEDKNKKENQEPKDDKSKDDKKDKKDDKGGDDDKKKKKKGSDGHENEVKVLKEFLKSWKDVAAEKITLERLTGLSNAVYKVTTDEEASPKVLILRKFGDTSDVVDKDLEDKVFKKMSDLGKGPKCYGSNDEYRAEEFFDSKTIKIHQVNEPEWRRKLALAIANHHEVEMDDIKKENIILQRLKDEKFWKAFDKKCKSDKFTGEAKKKVEEIAKLRSKEEFEFVESIVPKENLKFSHNDTLCNNVLISEKENKLVLIDYEYSGYNNRAFDAADMFVESMMDYDEDAFPFYKIRPHHFPSKDDVEDFARYYLFGSKHAKDIEKLEATDKKLKDDAWLKDEIKKHKDFEDDLQVFMEEFNKCCILSQFYWVTWGLVMAKPEDKDKDKEIEFDYLSFAYDKCKYYKQWKEAYKNNKTVFDD